MATGHTQEQPPSDLSAAEILCKKVFVITILGAIAYIGAVILFVL